MLKELSFRTQASCIAAQRSIDEARERNKKPSKREIWYFTNFIRDLHEELYIMAKQGRESNFGDFKFCSVTLTADDKIAYDTWAEKHGNDLLSVLAQCTVEGWKTSLTWDGENECFIGSLTCRSEGHKNENVVVVSRSDDMLEALAITLYKITELYRGKKLPTDKIKNNWG